MKYAVGVLALFLFVSSNLLGDLVPLGVRSGNAVIVFLGDGTKLFKGVMILFLGEVMGWFLGDTIGWFLGEIVLIYLGDLLVCLGDILLAEVCWYRLSSNGLEKAPCLGQFMYYLNLFLNTNTISFEQKVMKTRSLIYLELISIGLEYFFTSCFGFFGKNIQLVVVCVNFSIKFVNVFDFLLLIE